MALKEIDLLKIRLTLLKDMRYIFAGRPNAIARTKIEELIRELELKQKAESAAKSKKSAVKK